MAGERGEEARNRLIERRKASGKTESYRSYQAAYRAERRAKMDAAKSVPCMDCNQKFDPICMDFDHRPGEEKLFDVGKMRDMPWGTVAAEMAKCDVVCANCHRLRTKRRYTDG